jgi:hypothetical protein
MNHRVSIPKPCHEDWNAMTPNEQGRFCGQCAKTVTDFTGMNALEIQSYLLENSGTRVCGRFRSTQLDTVTITIPEKVLYSQTKFRNIFLLALLVTMGTTFLSCNNGRTIGDITIVETDTVTATQDNVRPETIAGQPDDSDTSKIRLNDLKPLGKVELTGAVVVDPVPPKPLRLLDHVFVGEVAPVMANDSITVKVIDTLK